MFVTVTAGRRGDSGFVEPSLFSSTTELYLPAYRLSFDGDIRRGVTWDAQDGGRQTLFLRHRGTALRRRVCWAGGQRPACGDAVTYRRRACYHTAFAGIFNTIYCLPNYQRLNFAPYAAFCILVTRYAVLPPCRWTNATSGSPPTLQPIQVDRVAAALRR